MEAKRVLLSGKKLPIIKSEKGNKMILLYTYFPLFDEHLAGGMQSWTRGIVRELTARGMDIRVICPKSKLHKFPDDICVLPILDDLEVDGLLPVDYYKNLQTISEWEQKADFIWTIDRPFPIKSNKPKLLTIGTFCYEREMKAIFQDDYTAVTVPSKFTLSQFDFYRKDIEVIPFFIDEKMQKKEINIGILSKYFEYSASKKYILFPHRAELSKGHIDAINMLAELLKYDMNYVLLIPEAPDSRLCDVEAETSYIKHLKKLIKDKNLQSNVQFHKWVDANDMPYYLSAGRVALFLTQLPETFGISLINCVACGTRVISYGSGALREVIPEGKWHHIIQKNDYRKGAEVIHSISSNDEKLGLEDLQKYRLELVADEYQKILQKILNR